MRVQNKDTDMIIHTVGKFGCDGSLLAIDPCYEDDNDGAIINNMKEGTYTAHIIQHDTKKDWGIRNTELLVIHDDYKVNDIFEMLWGHHGEIGVDGGIAGFIKPSVKRDENFNDQAYHMASAQRNHKQAGTLNGGVFSSSGYGDGSYDVWEGNHIDKKKNGLLTKCAAKIHFWEENSIFLDFIKLKNTKDEDLPLLIEVIRSKLGKEELERRLSELN